MIKALLKHPLFMIGLSFVVLLVAASLIHMIFFGSHIPEQHLLYKDGKLVAHSPLSPTEYPPFGTNKRAESMLFRILMGAKYTIGIAVVVALLRLVISIAVGLFYGNYLMKVNRFLSRIIESFHYVPMALLAFILLSPVLLQGAVSFDYNLSVRILFELAVLTIIALPTTILFIGNETNLILRQEFMTGVRLMGASRFYILRRHVIPHLLPRLWILFVQQVIQVLILLVHLGILELFFGGTRIFADGYRYSFSGEWSGVVGQNLESIESVPWIPLFPLMMFALTILAMHFILEGLKDVFGQDMVHKVQRKKTKRGPSEPLDSSAFEFVSSKGETTHQG